VPNDGAQAAVAALNANSIIARRQRQVA
jgi:hypothetical protein